MKRSLGLKVIVYFYIFFAGLSLSLSLLQLLSVFNKGISLYFLDLCFDFIAENTILSKEILELIPQGMVFLFIFSAAFLSSVFYTALAEALFLGKIKGYIIGILLHAYSAVSALVLWVLGINTLKFLGIFFFSMHAIKAIYLYSTANKNRIQPN